jgi:organic radical activating enzyme
MTGLSMLIWVTSGCNLKCPLCIVRHAQKVLDGYEMGIAEVKFFIQSCKDRKIHFDTIIFTGGEPTVWKHLFPATVWFYLSGITDKIALISNGCLPQKIFDISPMLSHYAISATQATAENIELFKRSGDTIVFNNEGHRTPQTEPVENSLPAVCGNSMDLLGKPTNQIHYMAGKVYYCCNALIQSEHTGLTDDLVCDFTEDFIQKFSNKLYDKAICSYCLCNDKVWQQTNPAML